MTINELSSSHIQAHKHAHAHTSVCSSYDAIGSSRYNDSKGIIGLSPKKRLEYIDLAKGIGIILMVAYHCQCEFLKGFVAIEMLFMPLFFIVSGMFFNIKGGYMSSIEKKVNKLLIPFVVFYFAAYMLNWCAYELGLLSVQLAGIPFIGLSNVGNMNAPIWFLFALFDLYVTFYIVFRILRNAWLRMITIAILLLCGIIVSGSRIDLPLYLSQALFSLPFFCYGYLIEKLDILNNSKLCRVPWWGWVLLLSSLLFVCINIPLRAIFMAYTFEGNWLLINICSLSIAVCFLFLCKYVDRLPFVSYIGRYSLVVLCTHMLVITICLKLWNVFMTEIEMPRWLLFPCVLALSSILIYPSVKYMPYFVAQKDLTQLLRKWGRYFKRSISRRAMDLQ